MLHWISQVPWTGSVLSGEPTKKKPEGNSVAWVADRVGWEIPTWFATKLYVKHNSGADIVGILNNLAGAIRKAEAGGTDDGAVLKFEWWRKPTPRARKEKPLALKSTLYMHPEYDTMWMLVERDND